MRPSPVSTSSSRVSLSCPFCRQPLSDDAGTLACASGHSFDVAREGYVNLAVGRSRGDSKDMLLARRRFLQAGYYRPVSDTVNELIHDHLVKSGENSALPGKTLLDVGCGEGYYLRRAADHLRSRDVPTCCVGIDSARDAIRLAAKSHPTLCWVVADVWRGIPLLDGSCHVLLNIFAPRNPTEFARVMLPGGLLLIVIPAPAHLTSLRSHLRLLQIEDQKEEGILAAFAKLFEPVMVHEVTYDIRLTGERVVDLITMSPTYRHVGAEELQSLRALGDTRADVALKILILRRSAG